MPKYTLRGLPILNHETMTAMLGEISRETDKMGVVLRKLDKLEQEDPYLGAFLKAGLQRDFNGAYMASLLYEALARQSEAIRMEEKYNPSESHMVMKFEEALRQRGYVNTTEPLMNQDRPFYSKGGFLRPSESVIIDRDIDRDGAFFVSYTKRPPYFVRVVLSRMEEKKEYHGRFNGETCEPLDGDAPTIKQILRLCL